MHDVTAYRTIVAGRVDGLDIERFPLLVLPNAVPDAGTVFRREFGGFWKP